MIKFMSVRKAVSAASAPLKYCLAQINPSARKAVSTKSAPLSFGLKGITAPVAPLSQCGYAP